MDTQEQNETPDKKVDAASAQVDAKDTKPNQELENDKIETNELDETQLGNIAAGWNPEAMRYYMRQKGIK